MITLAELNTYLNDLLQCSLFADYGPNGLQVQGKPKIKRIGTAVSASIETIQAARQANVDALIVHHGIFWNGDPLPLVGSKYEKVDLLLKQGISLFAYHLPLDAHAQLGNNWKAALDMGWKELTPFGNFKGVPIGVKGRIAPMKLKELQNQLETYYQHPGYCAAGGKDSIETLALISGGAHKSIGDAVAAGVDCFITGSFDEPIWHIAREEKINFFAMGHSATERVGPIALGEHLKKQFNLETQFFDIFNPF